VACFKFVPQNLDRQTDKNSKNIITTFPTAKYRIWEFLITKYVWHPFIHIGISFFWRNSPTRARAASFLRVLNQTQRHVTVARTPLDYRKARRRDLHLTTHNAHNRQTSMTPSGFEPAIPSSELPQTRFRPLGHWDWSIYRHYPIKYEGNHE
jgi:hypothetical protein